MTTKSQQVAAIINAFGFLPGHVLHVGAGDRFCGLYLEVRKSGKYQKRRGMEIDHSDLDALRDEILAVSASVATIKKGIAKADGFAKHARQRAAFVKLSAEEQAEAEAERERLKRVHREDAAMLAARS